MAEADSVAIKRLRWPVRIATRQQLAQIDGPGIDEVLKDIQPVRADVQSLRAMTFWGVNGEQIDTPLTHAIVTRWLDYVTNDHIVVRTTFRRDGTPRTECFRVRRVRELGRKQFTLLEVELEQVEG